jgi:hypothetical protein
LFFWFVVVWFFVFIGLIVAALQVLAESGSSAKEADLWTRIQSSPVKTAKDLMALEGFADLLGRPWRRAYRSKGLAVETRFADSVQFHCEFQKSRGFRSPTWQLRGHNGPAGPTKKGD